VLCSPRHGGFTGEEREATKAGRGTAVAIALVAFWLVTWFLAIERALPIGRPRFDVQAADGWLASPSFGSS